MDETTGNDDRRAPEDPRLRRLVERHEELERRLDTLQELRWLSDEERMEEVRLKKRKLALRDEMERLRRRASTAAR